jgi:hypothetical protein
MDERYWSRDGLGGERAAEDRPKLPTSRMTWLVKQLRWCFDGYDVQAADTRSAAIAVCGAMNRPSPGPGVPPDPEGVPKASRRC